MSNIKRFSSRKEVTEFLKEKEIDTSNWSEEKWLSLNKGQAEIHIMDLAEKIYDAMNESTPEQLEAGEWHIPFSSNFDMGYFADTTNGIDYASMVKVSTAMAARTSYTVVGDEKEVDYEKMIGLHDRLIGQNPPHSSPMEHCARAMSDEEYYGIEGVGKGWCRNYKGFIQYRHLIENKKYE